MICKKSGHKSLSGFQDVSFEGYKKHLVSAAAPGPLSREELEREEVKQAQIHAAVAVDTKKQLVTGKGVYLPTKSGHKIQRIWSQNSPNLVTKFTKSGHFSGDSSVGSQPLAQSMLNAICDLLFCPGKGFTESSKKLVFI